MNKNNNNLKSDDDWMKQNNSQLLLIIQVSKGLLHLDDWSVLVLDSAGICCLFLHLVGPLCDNLVPNPLLSRWVASSEAERKKWNIFYYYCQVPNPSPKYKIQSLEERDWDWGWQYNPTGLQATSDGKRPSMTFHNIQWLSMTFHDLLSPSKTSMTWSNIRTSHTKAEINSHSIPRLQV